MFIIRKTSESAYKDCLESITALKMPAGYIVKNAPYEILDVFSASDAYLDVCQAESPDISIILDDTVLPGRIIFAGNLIKHPCFDELRRTGEGYRVVGSFEYTDRIMKDTFWVGVYPGLTEAKLTYMIESIRKAVGVV